MSTSRTAQPICPSGSVVEGASYGFRMTYQGKPRDGILVRHRGIAYGYLNQCVHMPRRLDCEAPNIFDDSGQFIRCSMHGITYDPSSGECQSEICAGRSLTAVKIKEDDGYIYLVDKRARLAV